MKSIKEFSIKELLAYGECNLFQHGTVRDYLSKLDQVFENGNVYGIVGEFGLGGAALSSVLAGQITTYDGDIYVENKIENNISQYICYVGEDLNIKKKMSNKRLSVKEQIEYGINNKLSYIDNIDEIKEKFQLSNERFNRNIEYFSGERWRASMAVGYANGKQVYCFPWMNKKYLIELKYEIKECIEELLKIKAIILIPTTKQETIFEIYKNSKIVDLKKNMF